MRSRLKEKEINQRAKQYDVFEREAEIIAKLFYAYPMGETERVPRLTRSHSGAGVIEPPFPFPMVCSAWVLWTSTQRMAATALRIKTTIIFRRRLFECFFSIFGVVKRDHKMDLVYAVIRS